MKYVIMCGGTYENFEVPKHLTKIRGERIVDRTIRLLKENNIKDIVITSNNPIFDSCGVPRISNEKNNFTQKKSWVVTKGCWLDAFYHFNEPCCYLFGDVCYSDKAIKKIIETTSDSILLFGSNPKSNEGYLVKTWYEPFAFKVFDYNFFYKKVEETRTLHNNHKLKRPPSAWELYRCIFNLDVNSRDFEEHYITINDYTTDIDNLNVNENDAQRIEYFMSKDEGTNKVLSKVFGIISWLPDDSKDRELRVERLNRTFEQIHNVFGDVNFLVVAQNWKDYKVPKFVKNIDVFKYDKLGILEARKKLRQHFLDLNYDYLIMCDDDIIIETDGPLYGQAYLDELDFHPQGFIFLQYDAAQLNLCAISRFIYEQEPMVDIDPQKYGGYEDTIFSNLLHYKYPSYEFKTIHGIRCTQFMNSEEKAPSTWSKDNNHQVNWRYVCLYIEQFKNGDFSMKLDPNKYPPITPAILSKLKWFEEAIWYGWVTKEEYNEFKKKYGL